MGTSRFRRPLSAVGAVAVIAAGLSGLSASPAFAATVSVSPGSAANNQVKTLTFGGGNWVIPSTESVTLTRLDPTTHAETTDSISDTAIDPSSTSSSLKATFDLTAAGPGQYDVAIDPGSPPATEDSCSACFTVVAHAPTLTAVAPGSQGAGTSQTVTLTGSNFARGATISVLKADGTPDSSFAVTNLSVTSTTSATAKIAAPSGAAPGPRTVQWKNSDGQIGNCGGCLVINGAPTIGAGSPSTLGQGADRDYTIVGTGFISGATVGVFHTVAGDDPTIMTSNVRVDPSGTSLIVHIVVSANEPTGFSAGKRTLTVTNPDGGSATKQINITLAPRVNSVVEHTNDNDNGNADDSSQTQGSSRVFDFTAPTGQGGFAGGVNFYLGPGVSVTNYIVTSSSLVTATVTVAADAAPGTRDVDASNADGGGAVCSGCFAVTAAPTVTSVSPNTIADSDTGTLTVHGTGFVKSTANTIVAFGPGVHATPGTATVANDGLSLTQQYTVDSNAPQGPVSVMVTNPDGGSGSCASCLFVSGLQVTNPQPNNVFDGDTASNQAFTVDGTNFGTSGSGPTVQLVPDPAIPGQGPIDAPVSSASSTQLHFNANLTLAAPGTYDVDVTNPGANPLAGRCDTCLTIVSDPPTMTSLSDDHFVPGQVKTITLTGTNFSNGMTAVPGVTGVTAGPVAVTSTTTATVTVSVASNVSPGPTHTGVFKVKLADGTLSNGKDLTIAAAPTLDISWPTNVAIGGNFSTFDAVVDNTASGTGGAPFNGRIDFTLSGISGMTANKITLQYDTGGSNFVAVPLSDQPDGSITGYLPPQGGTALAANGIQTTHLRIKVASNAPSGSLKVDSSYGDVASNARTDTVATDTDTVGLHSAPSAPRDVVAEPGNRSALITWSPPSSDGSSPITSYVVTASPGGAHTTTGASATSGTVTGLTNGTSYTFKVVAKNSIGSSPAGGPTAAIKPHTPRTSVNAPAALAAGGSAGMSVTLNNDTVTAYPKVRLNFTLTLPGLSTGRVTLVDTSGGGHTKVALTGSGGRVTGTLPASGSFALTSKSSQTIPFTISLDGGAPTGTLNISARLTNVNSSPVTLSSDTGGTAVAGKTARFVAAGPTHFVDSRTGLHTAKGRHTGKTQITLPSTVPLSARSVVLDVQVISPSSAGALFVYPTGGAATNQAVSFQSQHSQAQTTITRMGARRHVTLRLSKGSANLAVDLLGYNVDSGRKGGRFVAMAPARVSDTRGTKLQAERVATVTLPSAVPANAVGVLVNVTAVHTVESGLMKVYATGAGVPKAVALDFVKGASHSATYVTKLGPGRKITVHIYGKADVTVDLLGYYDRSTSYSGRLRSLTPSVLTSSATSGHRTLTLPASIPANATAVVLSVTAQNPSAAGSLRAYATGTSEPTAIAETWAAHRDVSNLVVTRIGAGRKVTFHVTAGSVRLHVVLMGYTTG